MFKPCGLPSTQPQRPGGIDDALRTSFAVGRGPGGFVSSGVESKGLNLGFLVGCSDGTLPTGETLIGKASGIGSISIVMHVGD